LKQHRVDPTCAGCHDIIDPLGFAFENFDAVGKFRDKADGVKVDASGVLWDGTKLDGADGLYQVLLARKDLFVQNFTEKLMTYALGRKVEYYDMPAVRKVMRNAAAEDYRFSALVREIALSDAFTQRSRIETTAEGAVNTGTAQR
jgi:hypothetical protein